AELAPALKLDAYAGTLREELPRKISNRLGLSEARLAALLSAADTSPKGSRSPAAPPPAMTDPAVRTERTFLALCIALPEAGRRALQAIDPDQHLTSDRLRRA